MSRTKRTPDPYRDPNWKATADKKRWSKPTSRFKKTTSAQRKAAARQALRTMADPDELIVPEPPKSDVWEWN